jgi:hypothetical protein
MLNLWTRVHQIYTFLKTNLLREKKIVSAGAGIPTRKKKCTAELLQKKTGDDCLWVVRYY